MVGDASVSSGLRGDRLHRRQRIDDRVGCHRGGCGAPRPRLDPAGPTLTPPGAAPGGERRLLRPGHGPLRPWGCRHAGQWNGWRPVGCVRLPVVRVLAEECQAGEEQADGTSDAPAGPVVRVGGPRGQGARSRLRPGRGRGPPPDSHDAAATTATVGRTTTATVGRTTTATVGRTTTATVGRTTTTSAAVVGIPRTSDAADLRTVGVHDPLHDGAPTGFVTPSAPASPVGRGRGTAGAGGRQTGCGPRRAVDRHRSPRSESSPGPLGRRRAATVVLHQPPWRPQRHGRRRSPD